MNPEKEIFIKTKDFSVSNEEFELLYNSSFDMLETFPQPEENKLGSYYESENYISHTDARKTLLDQLYQLVKKFTITRKVRRLKSFELAGNSLLDIGCGTGDFLEAAKKKGWNVAGVEPNMKARQLAIGKLKSDKERIFTAITELDNNSYDVISLWHVLEHVPNLEDYVYQLKKLLKPNGVLIIAVPNFKSFDAIYYKEYWAAYDVPRHLWHFSRKSIKHLFEKGDLKLLKTAPMIFDAFYVSMLSEKYKTGKTNYFKAFYIGLLSNFKAWSTKEHSSHIYILKRVK